MLMNVRGSVEWLDQDTELIKRQLTGRLRRRIRVRRQEEPGLDRGPQDRPAPNAAPLVTGPTPAADRFTLGDLLATVCCFALGFAAHQCSGSQNRDARAWSSRLRNWRSA